MVDTSRLGLPLLEADQALKHITHNEALVRLDGLIQLAVEERDVTTPPGSPTEGEMYGVGTSATGDWSGHDGELALWTGGGWRYAVPDEGWLIWDKTDGVICLHQSGDWDPYAPELASMQNMLLIGINTTADTTNRLAVSSDAALFTHDAAGSGDVRIKLNKSAEGGTASHLFQQDFDGYAEFGLTGDNHFRIKVSPDNFSTSFEALRVENDTGEAWFEKNATIGSYTDGTVSSDESGVTLRTGGITYKLGVQNTAFSNDGGDLIRGYKGDDKNFAVQNNGNVVNANNAYGSISDERLKQDILAASSQWDDIKGIQLRKYRLRAKVEKDASAPQELGVIAQEVAAVSPGLVSESAEGVLGVKYSILYLKALGALQEAMSRIEALEARLSDD